MPILIMPSARQRPNTGPVCANMPAGSVDAFGRNPQRFDRNGARHDSDNVANRASRSATSGK
jgi:hypothetical protein